MSITIKVYNNEIVLLKNDCKYCMKNAYIISCKILLQLTIIFKQLRVLKIIRKILLLLKSFVSVFGGSSLCYCCVNLLTYCLEKTRCNLLEVVFKICNTNLWRIFAPLVNALVSCRQQCSGIK